MCAKQTAAEAEEKINGVLKYTDDFRKPFHHFPVQNAKKYNSCTANIKPARGTHNMLGSNPKAPSKSEPRVCGKHPSIPEF